MSLPATRAAAPRARRFVARQLPRWGCTDLVADAQLCASELANNMVQHAPRGGFLSMALLIDRVRLTLIDHGGTLASRRAWGTWGAVGDGAPAVGVDAPRGLLIVSRLAADWGVEPHATGRGHAVWCDLLLVSA